MRLSWISLTLLLSLGWLVQPAVSDEGTEFFERRVRPLLAANCFSCHGEKQQESQLRLDSRDAILKGGELEGPSAVVGDPDHSPLMRVVKWEPDADLKMPPERQLRPDEVAILDRWIRLGMPWPKTPAAAEGESWRQHWAFQPIQKTTPSNDSSSWSRTWIDAFIVDELKTSNLKPADEADRRTLIRRATFDLLGVPPTPEEITSFVEDSAPDAWERLLTRLLSSPHYGERWGRHWLDVARYADTKGYVFFEEKKYPWAYTYRDYVINAFNSDLPYDRFVREQLAADQLPDADPQSLTALGFLTVGSHFMNNTHDIIDDRIDVVTRGLLGLTVTCSRCHDHKYDPIPAADYYALYGVFRSCYEPLVLPTFQPPPDNEEHRKFQTEMQVREKKLVDFITAKHSELVKEARTRVIEYLQAAYRLRDQPPTDDFMLLVDKGDLNPTMILRWQVYINRQTELQDPVWKAWHAFATLPEDSFSSTAPALLQKLSADASATVNARVLDALRSKPIASMLDVVQLYGELFAQVEKEWQQQLAAAAEKKTSPPERFDDPATETLRQVLYGENSPPDVPLAMDWGFLSLFPDRPTQGEYQKLLKEVETWMMTGAGAPPRAMVLLDSQRPYQPRIFLRGNPHRLGEPVERRFLQVLDEGKRPFQNGSGRLELAAGILNPENPLTARVIVNRVWLNHFGQGLVRTPSDFGLRSEPPSYPELLDRLAAEFMEHDWSIKWLNYEIMRSAVYRQKNVGLDRTTARTIDPENRLLWEFPRRRIDFEQQRDALLAVAESLDSKMGGPPVELLGDAVVPRRTIYAFLDRMDVPTLLTTFDFPNPLTTSPQRTKTMVAPQALFEMNSGFIAEIAKRLASRQDLARESDIQRRVSRQYEICWGRPPSADELAAAVAFLGPEPDANRWQQFAHALLLTNEFVFVD